MNPKSESKQITADLTGLLLILEYASEQASMLALPSTAQLIDQALWSIRPKLAVVGEHGTSCDISDHSFEQDDPDGEEIDLPVSAGWRC